MLISILGNLDQNFFLEQAMGLEQSRVTEAVINLAMVTPEIYHAIGPNRRRSWPTQCLDDLNRVQGVCDAGYSIPSYHQFCLTMIF